MDVVIPQDIKSSIDIVLGSLHGFNQTPLKQSLKEIVDIWDSPSFKNYRTSFFKLQGLSQGHESGIRDSGENVYFKNAVTLGSRMDVVKHIQLVSERRELDSLTKNSLELCLGGMYTNLEVMAAHEEALNHAYQH